MVCHSLSFIRDQLSLLFDTVVMLSAFIFLPIIPGVKGKLDVMYLIDGSQGVPTDTFMQIKKLVNASLNWYNISDTEVNVGISSFGENTDINLKLREGTRRVVAQNTLDGLFRPKGLRGIDKALNEIRTKIFEEPGESRLDAKKVLVLVTTGIYSADGASRLPDAAIALREKGIDIVVLSLGKTRSENELKAIAGNKSNVVKVDDVEELPEAFGILEKKVAEAGG